MRRNGVTPDSRELAQGRGAEPKTPISEKVIRVLAVLGQLAALIMVLIQRGCS
jgi:hypothetical protein